MKKLIVITRDGKKPEAIANLFGDGIDVQSYEGSQLPATSSGDNEVDTLLIDIETLTHNHTSVKKALDAFWKQYPSAAVVVMADNDQAELAVEAVKAGAFTYLTHPIMKEELDLVVDRVRESDVLQSELDYLRGQFWDEESLEVIETRSASMRAVFEKVRQVAGTRTTVLLTGETGTGKSLIAKLIHSHSARRNEPFISVHCGAIPDTLVESELFGHEKGAFTGASRRKLGRFELANGGTIFLDEIGTITQSVQIKLLDVIQERRIQRLGGDTDIPVDVRIIAATNENLGELCRDGMFRHDLFYRLNVFPIVIPPLRDRKEDILRLSESFIRHFAIQLNKDIRLLHPDVVEGFEGYDWPGNIRELENLIERACILESGYVLTPSSFPVDLFDAQDDLITSPVSSHLSLKDARQRAVDRFETQYISNVLTECCGVIKDAARQADITTRQLNKLMTRHKLTRRQFKKS